jgi:hypothetical protein
MNSNKFFKNSKAPCTASQETAGECRKQVRSGIEPVLTLM